MIPCEKVSTLPTITLKLGGKGYKLSPEDYTLKVSRRRGHTPQGSGRWVHTLKVSGRGAHTAQVNGGGAHAPGEPATGWGAAGARPGC